MAAQPFGGCRECGRNDGYRNVERYHFFYCDKHKTVWLAGSNLFSSWRDEDEAVWRTNCEYLEDYELHSTWGRLGRFGDHIALPTAGAMSADELENDSPEHFDA